MVHLEEVVDRDLVREQPGPYEDDDEADYTDTDSSLSSAGDDFPSSLTSSETVLDRIYALKDMISPLKSTALVSGKGLYILSSGGLMFFIPYMMVVMEEQQYVELEREQKAKEMGSEIMGPGAQTGGVSGAKASL
ncbi:MAG: hypothetical protein Q9188_007441 [Gyalolechia gomerana]